ncbi:MAG: asparagine synthase C-terminal domain-containing protein [Nanoarchaeota archaeon]|nr:asparagine synthase C-terminal domain-containing protein [Nanoarchaeota archaeon]MBU0963369.1 asparagine synthase C-terminal domain-containing protein [Nanoarchaeota archaeon]
MNKKEWIFHINKLKTKVIIENHEKAKELLKNSVVDAVKSRIPEKKFGILFSGGVDSSTIALISKKFTNNFTCYTVGFSNSEDIESAKKVAKELKLNLKIKLLTLEEIESKIKVLVKILKTIDVVSIGVGLVSYIAAEQAKKDKVNIIFTGLGSEEIFAGYQRHKESKDVNKECWSGLKKMFERDLMRDIPIVDFLKMKIETPFLDDDVIKIAMQIPGKYKINEENKLILREVSNELGLKKEFAFRKKKAAQYGSNFIKALDKIAKKNGFKYKKDYLNSLK